MTEEAKVISQNIDLKLLIQDLQSENQRLKSEWEAMESDYADINMQNLRLEEMLKKVKETCSSEKQWPYICFQWNEPEEEIWGKL